MSITIHIQSSSEDLKSYKHVLKSTVKHVESLIRKNISPGKIDIFFYKNPEATLKESGIGGYTPCANVVLIPLDPNNKNFKRSLKSQLPYTLAHEINHAIRFRTPILRETLFEAIISEGLADHFAMEVTGRKKPPAWATALSDQKKEEFAKRASKEWNLQTYDHNAWFYGSKIKKIPRWTAYALGYDLVETYLRKNAKVKASGLISADASLFI